MAEVSAFDSVTAYDAGERNAPALSFDAFDNDLVTYTTPDVDIRGRRGFLPF